MTRPGPSQPSLDIYDPILPSTEAANYLGFRGKNPTRSLRRLNLTRSRLPGTGTKRYGIRLSVLNAYLASLDDPKSRARLLRDAEPDTTTPRTARGMFAAKERLTA